MMALPTTYMKFQILTEEKQSISGSQNHLSFTSSVFSFNRTRKQSEVKRFSLTEVRNAQKKK